MSVLSFLNQDSYQIYNRNIAKYCQSVNAAILLSDLINRLEYHSTRDELVCSEKYGNGWFYYTSEKCQERTILSRREQDSAIKILREKGLIQVQTFGLPARRHFQVNEEKILEIFGFSKKVYSLAENAKLDSTKAPNCVGGKRQTAPIYKELYKELYKEGNVLGDCDPLNSKKELNKEDNVLDNAKTLPFKFEKMATNKFPLKKDQSVLLQELLSLDLECDQDTLYVLIRTNTAKNLKDAINHLKFEIDKGTIFKNSKIAFLRSILSGKISVVCENVVKCKTFAKKIKKEFNWKSLKIADKYVVCEKCHKEIPLNLPIQEFCTALENLYSLSRQY